MRKRKKLINAVWVLQDEYNRFQLTSAAAVITAGSRLLPPDPALDHVGGTSDTGRDAKCVCRAVEHARAALHAAVRIGQFRRSAFHHQNPVRADRFTNSASDALGWLQPEGGDAGKISKSLHDSLSLV